MADVAKIERYRAAETIRTLKALLAHAKAGHITGLAVAWKCSNGLHDGAYTGEYERDPVAGMGALTGLSLRMGGEYERRAKE